MRSFLTFCVLLCAASLGACASTAPGGLVALSTNVSNNTLVYKEWSLNRASQVKNVGLSVTGGAAIIEGIDVVDDKGFVRKTQLKFPFTLQPDTTMQLQVELHSEGTKQHKGRLRIQCSNCDNVDDNGYFIIKLEQRPGSAKPDWRCKRLDFGKVAFGKTVTKRCVLANTGSFVLVIDDVKFAPGPNTGRAAFAWKSPSFPIAVNPDPLETVKIEFSHPH